MKLLKDVIISSFFVGFAFIKPIEDFKDSKNSIIKTDVQLLQFLYNNYRQHKDDFGKYLPSDLSIDQCKQVLSIEKTNFKKKMDSLASIREVIFSKSGMTQLGFIIAREMIVIPNFQGFLFKILREKIGRDTAAWIMYSANRILWFLEMITLISLSQDIRAISDKKKLFSKRYDECAKMLALFERM
jgi:hypothetical protein